MTNSEDWVKLATTDDARVAELLLRLSRSADKPPSLSLDWTVRQRRSRAPAAARELNFDAEMKRTKKRKKRKSKSEQQTRASPTTPLSWSAGTSSVSGGDGSEDLRSKVYVKNEAMSTTTSKRPRKKKTLSELREEETLLLKERKNLRKEMETMRLGVEEQRTTNAKLNRLKLDLECKKKLEVLQCSKDTEVREIGFSLPDLNLPVDLDSV